MTQWLFSILHRLSILCNKTDGCDLDTESHSYLSGLAKSLYLTPASFKADLMM